MLGCVVVFNSKQWCFDMTYNFLTSSFHISVTASLASWLRRPRREKKIPGSNPTCAEIFLGSSHTSDLKIGTPVATLPDAWRLGSVLGLVGPVSILFITVRWKVRSATSISVWQHIKLSEQIRPWDTLTCCWDIKQPTNNFTSVKIIRDLFHLLLLWAVGSEQVDREASSPKSLG